MIRYETPSTQITSVISRTGVAAVFSSPTMATDNNALPHTESATPETYTTFSTTGSGSGAAPTTPLSKRHHNPYHYDHSHGSKKQKQQRPNGAVSDANNNSNGGGSEYYRKDREEWTDKAISCLLDAYTEKLKELNKGNLRGRDWEEVAEMVSENGDGNRKSVEQCKNKIDNLKKRYKVELQRISGSRGVTRPVTGGSSSSWHWFKYLEVIMGNSNTHGGKGGGGGGGANGGESDGGGASGGDGDQSNVVLGCTTRQAKRFTPPSVSFANNLKPKLVPTLKWRRVVFKISGSALAGNCQNIDPQVAMQIASEVASACRLGLEVAIVVGGRNFFCGDSWISATGLERPTAYQIGMMATVMNSILLQSALEKLGVQTRVQSAYAMPELTEPYSRQRAIRHLEKGRVVIFGGVGAGAGNPLFTTDTAAALRASEINADALLKGTNVNGVYDCHSSSHPAILDHISFRDMVSRGVASMDVMAVTYCEENGIPVVVFNLLEPGNISKALCGDQVGTLIDQAGKLS